MRRAAARARRAVASPTARNGHRARRPADPAGVTSARRALINIVILLPPALRSWTCMVCLLGFFRGGHRRAACRGIPAAGRILTQQRAGDRPGWVSRPLSACPAGEAVLWLESATNRGECP